MSIFSSLRRLGFLACAGALVGASPAWAAAPKCRPNCPSLETVAIGTTIMPDPDALRFGRTGELFTSDAQRLSISANAAVEITLGFDFRIGSATFSSVFVNENAALSFGAALPTAGISAGFTPYITPYGADLNQTNNAAGLPQGGIYLQRGAFDAYADTDSMYDRADAQTAVKIVWYGTTQSLATGAQPAIYAEAILSGDNQGNNSFAFRWGTDSAPSQTDYGSQAGFVFYDQRYLTSMPGGSYATNSSASVFDVANGRVVGELFPGAVPEPTTWATMLLGFALIGWALRRRPRGAVALERFSTR